MLELHGLAELEPSVRTQWPCIAFCIFLLLFSPFHVILKQHRNVYRFSLLLRARTVWATRGPCIFHVSRILLKQHRNVYGFSLLLRARTVWATRGPCIFHVSRILLRQHRNVYGFSLLLRARTVWVTRGPCIFHVSRILLRQHRNVYGFSRAETAWATRGLNIRTNSTLLPPSAKFSDSVTYELTHVSHRLDAIFAFAITVPSSSQG